MKSAVRPDVWAHHDTMIMNLREWVSREIVLLRNDISKHAPNLDDDPSISKILKTAEDMNVQLFDLVRSIADRAEKEAKKKPSKE